MLSDPSRNVQVMSSPAPASIFSRTLRATSIGLLLLMTIVAFEGMSVATAMPTVVRSLHGMALYAWPFSAFMVANLFGIVIAGELADRFGPARPMVAGLLAFALGLLIAGTAGSMLQLILGRVVQGLGGGVLIVVAYVIIGVAIPAPLHPRIFGLTALAWVLPALIGPVIAGTLAEHGSWRLVFLGLLPLVAIGTVLLAPTLRRLRAVVPSPAAADHSRAYRGGSAARWPFALLAGAGVVLVQYAGERRDAVALPVAAAGLVALVLAVRLLLPIGTLTARRGLPAVVAMRGLAAGSFFAVDALVPLTLSSVHGYSAVAAGIPLTLGAVGWSGASWTQSRFRNVPRAFMAGGGMAAISVACTLMAVVAWGSGTAWLAYPAWIFGGLGMGMVMPTVSVLVLEFSTDADRGRNSAAMQIADAGASALTIGVGGIVVAIAESGSLGLPTAIGVVDVAMVCVALLGVAGASRLRRQTRAAEPESLDTRPSPVPAEPPAA
jgi:MFS family permease